MTARSVVGTDSPLGEHERVAVRTVLVLTAAVGAESAVIGLPAGLPVIVVPTAVLVVATLTRHDSIAAWSAGGVWLFLVPSAPEIAILVPLLMLAGCVGFAVGPGRASEWVVRDATASEPVDEPAGGWIEDDVPTGAANVLARAPWESRSTTIGRVRLRSGTPS